jgi:hypothetical protein
MSALRAAFAALLVALPLAAHAFGPGGGGGRSARSVLLSELAFALLTIGGSVLALRRARGERPFAAGIRGAALGFALWLPAAFLILGGSVTEVLTLAFFLYSPRVFVIGLVCGAIANLVARRRSE